LPSLPATSAWQGSPVWSHAWEIFATGRKPIRLRIAGGTVVFTYPSDDSTAPEHTILNFPIDDIERPIDELAKRGIRMEHYDMPNIKIDGKGIFSSVSGPKATAWSKTLPVTFCRSCKKSE